MENFKGIKNFKPSEFSEPEKMSPKLLKLLDALRDYLGRPIVITSSTEGKHSKNSQHYLGKAVDIIVPNYRGSLLSLYLLVERFNFTGIGLYPDWKYNGKRIGGLHLDVRDEINEQGARWIGKLQRDGSQKYLPLTTATLVKTRIVTIQKKNNGKLYAMGQKN